jgi:hypothetical protein
VIKGAGGRAFCAGGDVRQVVELAGSGKQNEALDFFAEEYKLNHMIATLKTPFVAILDGITSKENWPCLFALNATCSQSWRMGLCFLIHLFNQNTPLFIFLH